MKQESLEVLLIDRSLGELSTEAAELLGEYLVAHPEAVIAAKELEQTLDLARDFSTRDLAPVVPSVSASWRRAASAARYRAWWPQIAALAACLTLGMLIGWGGGVFQSNPTHEARTLGQELARDEVTKPPRSQLWSISRIAEASRSQGAPAARENYRITFDSRSLKPRVEKIQ
jgi:hypothetical protein